MSERISERREKEWADEEKIELPEEEERPDPYEPTYRDGSAKHECAAEDY